MNPGGRGRKAKDHPQLHSIYQALLYIGHEHLPSGTSTEDLESRTDHTRGKGWESHFSLSGRHNGGGSKGERLGQKKLWCWQRQGLPSEVLGVGLKTVSAGTSLAVQCLRLRASTTRGAG